MIGSTARPQRPRITILLCTYNGAAHLAEQLQSYLAQDHADWDLWVSDDGSTDATGAILEAFRRAHGQDRQHEVRLLNGPQRGVAANFLSLLCHPELPPGPVALSDQDDVWMPQKLSRALDALRQCSAVALYGGQSLHTDADLRVIGASRPPRLPPSFRNALVQNIVSGHSATLSAGALELVRRAGPPDGIPYQDWWLYQLISGAGGDVVIDTAPVLYYRQHGSNALGAHQGARAMLGRLAMVLRREYGDWISANLAALQKVEPLLSQENQRVLTAMLADRQRIGPVRAARFARLGLHRQGWLTTGVLYVAAALGRV
ncbi:MAG: glycosyltransferase [Rhodobacteraceae bacterium]|nr:glycosyltransferase [Paracoccaceae bacterium]